MRFSFIDGLFKLNVIKMGCPSFGTSGIAVIDTGLNFSVRLKEMLARNITPIAAKTILRLSFFALLFIKRPHSNTLLNGQISQYSLFRLLSYFTILIIIIIIIN